MPQRPHQEALLRAALTEIAGHPAHDLEDSDLASQPTPEDGVRWQDQPTRTRWALPAAAATILALGAAALVATNEQFLGGAEDGIAANGTELAQVDVVPVGEGSMVRFASASAQDWTRNSDWVAEVAVTAEHPTAEVHGTEEGEGLVVTREVELTVQRVLWQRTAPAHELPRQLSLWAAGWTKSAESSSTLTPLAFEGEPRLEIGHRYVVALVWVPRACSSGDGAEPAHWSALGSGAVIPFDEGKLGYGESEGRTVAGDEDQAQPRTLERELLGRDAAALIEELASAPAKPRSDVFPTASC